MTLNLKTVGKISLIFLAAELLSLVVYFNFLTANLAWTLILVLTAVLALYKLEYGLYFVLAELFLGGKGYLFFGDFGGGRISIRIALFVIILAIWLGQLIYTWIKQKKFPDNYFTIQKSSLFKYFVVLGVVLVWGFVWGYLRGNGFSNVFLDFNAYPYFLYLLPFYDVFSQKDFSKIMELLAAAVILIFVKTTVVFLLFTQNAADSILNPLYSWLRNTGVGEITYAGNGTTNLWRVFFQSQIYSLIGLLIFFYAAIKNWANSSKAQKIFYWLLIVLTSWTVVLSLSRSFWVGGVAALGCLLLYSLIWQRQIFWRLILSGMVLIVVILLQYQSMNYLTGGGGQINERLRNLATDAAGSTRQNELLPLTLAIANHPVIGSGFGTELTYKSLDPRVLKTNPDGWQTTYVFEWGYLDIALKVGLFGLVVYLLGIWKIVKDSRFKIQDSRIMPMVFGLIALLVVNIFSPYLNHPLGIGYLVLLTVLGKE